MNTEKSVHVCQSCGAVMAVNFHSSYQEVKDCLRGMKALCTECSSCLGSPPLPQERKHGGRPQAPLHHSSNGNDCRTRARLPALL
jgi:hypothetical protein